MAGAVIALVAVVVVAALVLMPSGESTAGVPTASTVTSSTGSASPPLTGAAAGPTKPADSTTVTTDSDGLASYTDAEYGFTVTYPASWENTSLTKLGDYQPDPYSVVGFADQSGPQQEGQFFNFVEVSVVEDIRIDESMLPAFEESMKLSLEKVRETYQDVRVLEPVRSVRIADKPGFAATLSLSFKEHTVVVCAYLLVADQRAYELEFSAAEEDFEECAPLFEKIIQDFSPGSSSPVI